MQVLKRFDGRKGTPLCLAVCGKVVDVSASENIKFGEGYGKLWAGSDATWALATLSLKAEDANKLDFSLSDLTKDQCTALSGWYKHFTTKYEVVGRLKEYDGWDFSTIHEEAKSQTPFGAKKTDGAAPFAGGAAPAASQEQAAKAADKPVMLSKGDRVRLVGMDKEEFEGKEGILHGFNAAEKGFEVLVDGDDKEIVVVKPSQIVKIEQKAAGGSAQEGQAAEKKEKSKGLPIGTRVWLFGMEVMHLEGAFGVIQGYNADQGTYELLMDKKNEKALVMSWQVVVAK